MSFERVLLVNPPSRGEWKGIRPHIGLGYIAESLEENGIEYDVVDMDFGYRPKLLLDKIDTFKPDLIGVRPRSIRAEAVPINASSAPTELLVPRSELEAPRTCRRNGILV